ncbi:hypothetical protein BCT75_04320 [Vibrio lentus]|uniref:hypothetical protein n=1 Tax=Vibrio lentus TaxID=136468 RepID=UPI000C817110|nr:hypothetical protein [Vibrio lentus]PML45614.1 hypothetical protein BCT75_04320 [Vibrio lentus]
MEIKKQHFKGQVFLKYLWQHSFYRLGETGVSPNLARDLKDIAVEQKWIDENKALDNAKIFHWITDSVIPKWGRLSAFILARKHGWVVVDYVDAMSLLHLSGETKVDDIEEVFEKYRDDFGITIPRTIINKILNEQK